MMGGEGVEDVFVHEEHDGLGPMSMLPREGPQNGLFVLKTRQSVGLSSPESEKKV